MVIVTFILGFHSILFINNIFHTRSLVKKMKRKSPDGRVLLSHPPIVSISDTDIS